MTETNQPQRRQRKPNGSPVFLTATWHTLIMVNFEVSPAILAPYLPAKVELDSWQGRTFVSVVGFRFVDTRVLRLPIPGHTRFSEVNLRFYVRRKADGRWRRGVVFIKEIAPLRVLAWIARTLYNEPYVTLPMSHAIRLPDDERPVGALEYRWRRGGTWESVSAEFSGEPVLPDPDSEARFVTEHYWGYTKQRNGSTLEYRVDHPPWSVWKTESAALNLDAASLYGTAFEDCLSGIPSSYFVADGSPVVVHRGTELA